MINNIKKFGLLILFSIFTLASFADFEYEPTHYQSCDRGISTGWQTCGATVIYKKYSGQKSKYGYSLSSLNIYDNRGHILWNCTWQVTQRPSYNTGYDSDGSYWQCSSYEAYENRIGISVNVNIYYYPSNQHYYIEIRQDRNNWTVFS